MNYVALYTSYIDRSLVSVKLSSVSDDIWTGYFGIDDGDLERTLWSTELAEAISGFNLNKLPLSIFCYDVLETHLATFFQKQYAAGHKDAKSSAVAYITQLIDEMQNVLS